MLTVVAVLLKFITSSRRARGKLKQRSDLLGIARGEVNKNGIAFFDGKRLHWFGPQHLLTSTSTKNGFRVRLDADPYRYLSLTKRLFDFYDTALARQLQQQWKDAAASVTTDEPLGIDLWRELCPMPDDAIPFRGTVTIQQPMKTPQNRKTAITESAASVVLVCMGMLGKDVFHLWVACGMVGWGVVSSLSSVRIWWKYFHGVHTQAWSQQGWISPVELAFILGSHGVRISLNEIRSCTEHGNLLVLSIISGGIFYLARDHVASKEEWNRITNQTSGMVGDALP